MFERFTEQARQVVVLAQDEGRTLGHNVIDSEHILLGLLRQDGALNVAANVLAGLDITYDRARAEVERMVGVGKGMPSGQIPFTVSAKSVLEFAMREAVSLGHEDIGTEHILLGLTCDSDTVAARVLLSFDADSETIRNGVIEKLRGAGRTPGAKSSLSRPSHGFADLWSAAADMAQADGRNFVEVSDLLVVLTREEETAKVMSILGIDEAAMRHAIEQAADDDQSAPGN